jgi:hypothetical protein
MTGQHVIDHTTPHDTETTLENLFPQYHVECRHAIDVSYVIDSVVGCRKFTTPTY